MTYLYFRITYYILVYMTISEPKLQYMWVYCNMLRLLIISKYGLQ